VLEPTGTRLSAQEQWMLPLIQGSITGDFNKYSAMTMIDRLNLEKILAEQKQSTSGNYSDADYIRIGHLSNARLILTGSVAKTANTFMLELSVTDVESGERKASYPPKSVSPSAIENLSAIKEASADLLGQLGVVLTEKGLQELKTPVTITVVQGQASLSQTQTTQDQTKLSEEQAQLAEVQSQIALAKGINAQRQGTTVEALSYFIQASNYNPSLSEAVSRVNILSANINSGNIGEDTRNDIAWRKAWVDRLQETENFFAKNISESQSYYLIYDTDIKQGAINYQKETVELNFWMGLMPEDILGKRARMINQVMTTVKNGLGATGRAQTWGLNNWPNKSISPTSPFTDRKNNLAVVTEILNEQGKSLGRQTVTVSHSYAMDTFSRNILGTITPRQGPVNVTTVVGANLITNRLSIRIISIDGSPAETVARQKRINILPVEEFIRITGTGTGTSKPHTDQALFTVSDTGILTRYTGEEKDIIIRSVIKGVFITSIGMSAFNSKDLSNLIIPSSVISIGEGAFSRNDLISVTIPNSVTSIGESAFLYNKLTSVNIPSSVTSIGSSAFSGNQLTSVTIPNSVTSIGESAFSNNQLTSVNIPNGVTSIGSSAFSNNKLTSVNIPNSVTSIGGAAFSNNQLTSVNIPNGVTSIGERTFEYNRLTSINIPNSVTSIGFRAFLSNQLTSITIGANVNMDMLFTFDNFDRYYSQNGKKAGTYKRSGDNWTYSSR
jgi:hypothetical protein